MLVEHDRIYLGAEGAATHALLVRDGRVVAVGDDALTAAGDDEVPVDGAPEGHRARACFDFGKLGATFWYRGRALCQER